MTDQILVRVPQWLGDAVVATIFLRRLKASSPQSEIVVLCPPYVAPIFETHPSVATVLKLSYSTGGTVFEMGRMLRKQKFSKAYILPRSFRSAFEVWLGRVPERIGFGGDIRSVFLTKGFHYDAGLLYADRYLSLLGDSLLSQGAEPYFPAEHDGLENLPKPVLALGLASVAPARTWMPDRFVEVAIRFLKERGGSVLLLGSEKERDLTGHIYQTLVAACQGASIKDLAGRLTLPQLGGVLKCCDLFVGNDSGLMHVSSVFKIPSVIIFGASDPAVASPPYGRVWPLQKKVFSCVPCLRNTCVRFGAERNGCLAAVTIDEVVQITKKVLS